VEERLRDHRDHEDRHQEREDEREPIAEEEPQILPEDGEHAPLQRSRLRDLRAQPLEDGRP
jgi:hypothetical protein